MNMFCEESAKVVQLNLASFVFYLNNKEIVR